MSSFFLPARPVKGEKKQRAKYSQKRKSKRRQSAKTQEAGAKRAKLNEEIQSESEEEEGKGQARDDYADHFAEEGKEEETAQEKRLRLAKQYLTELEEKELERRDWKELDREAIAHRLQHDVLEQSGRMMKTIADSYMEPTVDDIRYCRGHQLPLTCVTVTSDSKFVFSGAKDCSIIKWYLESGQKCCVLPGHRKGLPGSVCHTGHVLALAVSSDDKFLVSGGGDKLIHVWSVDTCTHLHTFRGHRGSVTGLVFRRESHQLFSCSEDRTIKLWNLDEMSYVETLYGHQDPVTSIDCLLRERPVTSGGADKSVRVWRVVEESQLVFGGHRASIDCVKLINEDHFVTGSQDGSVALWSLAKKKPVQYCPHDPASKGVGTCVSENWVSAVTALPFSDVVASGAADGVIHLWKCSEGYSSMHPLFAVHVGGCVNALAFSPCGRFLVGALGREHRFGRWWCDKGAKNRLVVIAMKQTMLNDSTQTS